MMTRTVARAVFNAVVRRAVRSWIRRQRIKIWFYDIWGYTGLLGLPNISLSERLALLRRFLEIDWNVCHAHSPSEIVHLCRAICERPARDKEVIVETGCWQGGSTAKLSLLCRRFGYTLHIFDSFQGVEGWVGSADSRHESTIETLRYHLRRYGDEDVCVIHKGWFAETIGRLKEPVCILFIDCDLKKGTDEVLTAVAPLLTRDAIIFSHDRIFQGVAQFLADEETWRQRGLPVPRITELSHNMLSYRISGTAKTLPQHGPGPEPDAG